MALKGVNRERRRFLDIPVAAAAVFDVVERQFIIRPFGFRSESALVGSGKGRDRHRAVCGYLSINWIPIGSDQHSKSVLWEGRN